jgi:hypothetical protein
MSAVVGVCCCETPRTAGWYTCNPVYCSEQFKAAMPEATNPRFATRITDGQLESLADRGFGPDATIFFHDGTQMWSVGIFLGDETNLDDINPEYVPPDWFTVLFSAGDPNPLSGPVGAYFDIPPSTNSFIFPFDLGNGTTGLTVINYGAYLFSQGGYEAVLSPGSAHPYRAPGQGRHYSGWYFPWEKISEARLNVNFIGGLGAVNLQVIQRPPGQLAFWEGFFLGPQPFPNYSVTENSNNQYPGKYGQGLMGTQDPYRINVDVFGTNLFFATPGVVRIYEVLNFNGGSCPDAFNPVPPVICTVGNGQYVGGNLTHCGSGVNFTALDICDGTTDPCPVTNYNGATGNLSQLQFGFSNGNGTTPQTMGANTGFCDLLEGTLVCTGYVTNSGTVDKAFQPQTNPPYWCPNGSVFIYREEGEDIPTMLPLGGDISGDDVVEMRMAPSEITT